MAAHDTRKALVPAGAVTGIGSLPFKSVTSAIEAVAELSPQVPFWPQLPQLSDREGILGQGLGAVAHLITPRREGYGYQVKDGQLDSVLEILHRGNGELTQANAVGFAAFEQALSSGLFQHAVAVKGQIAGPITLSAYLFYRERSFLSDPALLAAIAFHISQIICWQADRLKTAGLPVLLFVDEPALCLEVSSAGLVSGEQRLDALAMTLEEARARGAWAGLHCCAACPLEQMLRAQPDILSFDADTGLEPFFADLQACDFVHRGGTVAYGMVPTRAGVNALDSASIFARWLQAASQAGDPQEFARRAMITATCGLGLLSPSSVIESFSVAYGIGKLIRGVAGEQ
jgi:methionine synthase II (cobalamin-independent)